MTDRYRYEEMVVRWSDAVCCVVCLLRERTLGCVSSMIRPCVDASVRADLWKDLLKNIRGVLPSPSTWQESYASYAGYQRTVDRGLYEDLQQLNTHGRSLQGIELCLINSCRSKRHLSGRGTMLTCWEGEARETLSCHLLSCWHIYNTGHTRQPQYEGDEMEFGFSVSFNLPL